MKSTQYSIGRTFGVTFEHGSDFFEELKQFCELNQVKQGYIPNFIAGFSEVELVGTCEKVKDESAPVWTKVHLENVEALGGGTVAYDEEKQSISPHIHVSVGQKLASANGFMSHLLSAKVLFLVEMTFVEVLSPKMIREINSNLYNVPLLSFKSN